MMNPIVQVAVLVPGLAAFAGAMYLLGLALAALRYKPRPASAAPSTRVAVLVPAHNEAELIERCVASLRKQEYPDELYEIVVIADNCTDDTAGLARRAGARVLVRDEPDVRGKGPALRWAMDLVMVEERPPDAIVVIDADSVVDGHLLGGLVGEMEQGAAVVQGDYRVLREEGSTRTDLRAAAFLLFHRVRFAGRAVLHLPCALVGNGMLFSRSLLEAHPWNAFTSAEDLEYSMRLRLAGIGPRFAGSAIVEGPVPTSDRGEHVQRQRWEGGRVHVAREMIPKLLRSVLLQGHWSQADAIVDLLVPPLGLIGAATVLGLVATVVLAAFGVVSFWLVVLWAAALAAILGYVLVGLRAADAPKALYRALLSAPMFVFRKLRGTLGVLRNSKGDTWVRTERPSERAG